MNLWSRIYSCGQCITVILVSVIHIMCVCVCGVVCVVSVCIEVFSLIFYRMGNSNSASASVYNESHREISRIPPHPDGSIYSFSTVTSVRTNRTGMSSTVSRKRKGAHVLLEMKARFLGRYYMRRISETTLNKVQQHTRTIKGIKSKLKLSVDGLHTGYKQSSIVRTQVPASFVPLMKIHRLEVDPKYNNVLYCAQRTADDNFEVFTYRLRNSRDAFNIRQRFKDLYASYVGREMTFGVRNIVIEDEKRALDRDSDNESNWTIRNDHTTQRSPRTSSKSSNNIDHDYNTATNGYSAGTIKDSTINKNGTITRAHQGHQNKSAHLERELSELTRDVRYIKQIVTKQQSHNTCVVEGGPGDTRTTSTTSHYPASVATNDSGFTGELVSAKKGVVRAQGGNPYQQKLPPNLVSKWKSETALGHTHPGSAATSTTGTIYRTGTSAINGGPQYVYDNNTFGSRTQTYTTSIPPTREKSFYGDQSSIRGGSGEYQSATLGPSISSSTVLRGGYTGEHQTIQNGSAYGRCDNMHSATLGRPNFSLVYPHTPTTLRRGMPQTHSDHW